MTNNADHNEASNVWMFPVEHYQELIEFVPSPVFIADKNNYCLHINSAACHFLGYLSKEIIGKSINTFITNIAEFNSAIAKEKKINNVIKQVEWKFLNKNGQLVWGEVYLRFSPSGNLVFFINDINERKRAENELLKMASIVESSDDAIFSVGLDGIILSWNLGAEKTFYYTAKEIIGQNVSFLYPQYLFDEKDEIAVEIKSGGRKNQYESVRLKKDGKPIYVSLTISPMKNVNGEIIGASNIARDITLQKRDEAALSDSEEKFRALAQATDQIVWTIDANQGNDEYHQWWDELTGQTVEESKGWGWLDALHPEDREITKNVWQTSYNQETFYDFSYRVRAKDGEYRFVAVRGVPVFKTDGSLHRWVGTMRDITEQKRNEENLRESEERFRKLVIATTQIVWIADPEGKLLTSYNSEDGPFEKVSNDISEDWVSRLHPDDKERVFTEFSKAVQNKIDYQCEYRTLFKDNTYHHFVARGVPIFKKDGSIREWIGTLTDITESKISETEIFEKDEQLRQSQKVEAVGRLAGGIAHDFNNFLAVIMLHVDMLDLQLPVDSSLRYRIGEIKSVTNNAAGMVRQLLAFGRKQTLQPSPIVLNQIVKEFIKVLRPLVGEDIEIQLDLETDLGVCFVDANQIIQVLMNLAVNARDAMLNGGILKIKTSNVAFSKDKITKHKAQPFGSYIELSVSDNGIGMDTEIQSRIFEPFFTTKEVGKGTGLGLATVYGIVKQSKGFIWVESEANQGTTFEIQFPRIDQLAAIVTQEKSQAIPRGNETILLVEDEEPLRRATVEILTILGYKILEAGNADQAIKLIQSTKSSIDLLLTDVVMPKMNGKQLAEEVNILHPETAILFMSGYNDDIIAHHGILEKNVNFIGKPFTPNKLATKIREVLDV